MKKNIPVEKMIRIVALIVTISLCIPFLIAARYTIFMRDDFSFYNGTAIRNNEYWIGKVFSETVRCYMEWQGTYSSIFTLQFFNPLRTFSYRYLHIFLLLFLTAAIASVFLLGHAVAEYFCPGRKYGIYLTGGFLIPLLSYREYKEVYLWYTSAMVYLLPAFFFALGFSFLLLSEIKKNKIYLFLSAVFMFLMAGGVLGIVGVGAFCVLLLTIVDYFRNKKINRSFVIVFIVTLIGAVANAFAPGNFVRKQVIDDNGISVVKTAVCAVKVTVQETEWMYRSTTFLVFAILAFLLGCYINREVRGKIAVLSMCGLILLPIVAGFPIAMGYGNISADTLPGRCLFIIDAAVIVSGLGNAIMLGNVLYNKKLLPEMRTIKFIFAVTAVLVITVQGNKLSDYVPLAISSNLKSGSIQNFSGEWRDNYDQIRYSIDDKVTVYGNPKETEGCLSPGILTDSDWWVNRNVAEYFGKESVCLGE